MKTVKEAAEYCADSPRVRSESERETVKMIFEAGVDWAQRWSDVKDELPPARRQVLVKIKGTPHRYEGQSVVQKTEKPFVMYSLGGHDGSRDGRYGDGWYVANSMMDYHCNTWKVTHWRPIEHERE